METKVCTLCGQTFPKTEENFRILRRNGKENFCSRCRECERAAQRRYDDKYRAANREKLNAAQRARWACLPEEEKIRRRNQSAEWARDHKDYLNEKARERYATGKYQERVKRYLAEHAEEKRRKSLERYYANKDKAREQHERWKAENPEKVREARQRYKEKHREEILQKRRESYENRTEEQIAHDRELRRKYREADKARCHRRRALQRGLEATFTPEQWEACKIEFRNVCAYCGRAIKLSQDHVVPVVAGGTYTVGNIVPACKRCNSSKSAYPFTEWYRKQTFYNEERERHVLKYLGKEIAV